MSRRPSPSSHPVAAEMRGVALYERLRDHLRQRIADGEWRDGERLPGRAALARDYRVNLATVQRAIAILLAEGILQAASRQGTFVRRRPATVLRPAQRIRLGILARPGSSAPSMRGTWSGGVANGIREAADALGAEVVLARVRLEGGRPDWAGSLAALGDGDLAATILIHQEADRLDPAALLPALSRHQRRTVLAGWEHQPLALPQIAWDQWEAGHQAAAHLIAGGWCGLRLFCPFAAPWAGQRWQGAEAAARACGLVVAPPASTREEAFPADPLRVAEASLAPARLFVARGGLRQGPGGAPAGVIAGNDSMALGLLRAAADAGLRAGRDFGLVGFDDLPEACILGLTSLRPPFAEMGRLAAEAAIGPAAGLATGVHLRLRLCPRASSQAVG